MDLDIDHFPEIYKSTQLQKNLVRIECKPDDFESFLKAFNEKTKQGLRVASRHGNLVYLE